MLVADNSSFSVSAIGALAAVAALIAPEGVVATFGTGFFLTGAATLLGASVFEGINERRKLKTIQKQMEILKKHIPAYMLYSDVTDAWLIGTITRKVIGYGGDIFTAITAEVLDAMLIARYSSATSAKNETLLVTSRGVGDFRSILYSLYTERKGFFPGEPTSEVSKILKVLRRELVHIAWVVGCRCQAETQGLSSRSAHEAFDKPDFWA